MAEAVGARAPVKRYPLRLVRQHEPRRDHQLCKIVRQYSHLLVPLKVDPRLLQQLYGFRSVHVVTGGEGPLTSATHGGIRRTQGWLEKTHLMLKWKLNCHVDTSWG